MPLIGVSSLSFYASLRTPQIIPIIPTLPPALQCSIGGGQAPIPSDDPSYLSSREITVTGSLSGGTVWGSNPYTEDSDMNKAAVHAGLVTVGETKNIIQYDPADYSVTGGGTGYISSTQNGITTTEYTPRWCGLKLKNKINPTAGEPVSQFVNGNFSDGLNNWEVVNEFFSPGAVRSTYNYSNHDSIPSIGQNVVERSFVTQLLGCPVPADPTPFPMGLNGGTGGLPATSPGVAPHIENGLEYFRPTFSTTVVPEGPYLDLTINSVKILPKVVTWSGETFSGGTLYGPAVHSQNPVIAAVGDKISFRWRANAGEDAYNIFSYIIDPDQNCRTFIMVDATADSDKGSTPWTTASKIIQPGEAGNYYFVFISGAFDWNFGGQLGATLNVDDVKIEKAGTY
jgi:hypothetical protein